MYVFPFVYINTRKAKEIYFDDVETSNADQILQRTPSYRDETKNEVLSNQHHKLIYYYLRRKWFGVPLFQNTMNR